MEEEGKLPSDIIGMKAVHEFAGFYLKHPEEIARMRGACLIQYCEDKEFSAEEYNAFKLGVATVLQFFLSATAESETILKAKEKLKK